VIDADKILDALRSDPMERLKTFGSQAAAASQSALERLRTDESARRLAMVGAGSAAIGLLAGASAPRFLNAMTKFGAVAAIGGLAYAAFVRSQAAQDGAPVPAREITPAPAEFLGEERHRLAEITLKAMINAVKADGRIEEEEKARLFDRLGQVSLTEEEREFMFDELAKPMDTDGLVRQAGSPAMAAHVYASSLLAIDPNGHAEKAYLHDLATRLKLSGNVVSEIHAAS
jgi:uncharacterized membrane protein YebE (DUF533 family)